MRQPDQRVKGVSRVFVIGILAVGVLLGFTLGLYASGSIGGERNSSALYDEDLVTSVVEIASPAVVEITVSRGGARLGLRGSGTSSGSGFLVDDQGHIITNNHVVDGATDIVVRLSDGRTLDAKKLGASPADDPALIEVEADEVAGIRPLPLTNSSEVRPGQIAIAIGSPLRNFNSVTVGVVSGTGRGPSSILRRPIPNMIQTDAPLNPGNSGGPLLNSKGEVIGVNSSVRSGSFQRLDDYRIGFAVPSNTVRGLLPELLKPQQVRRPWLGISGGPVTGSLADTLGLPRGIYVARVFPDSPAEMAGLVPFATVAGTGDGDVITAVDGRPVSAVDDMVSYFNELRPGEEVTLSVVRNSQEIEVDVTLTEWPDT